MTTENVAEDTGEVYDVGHHDADILIPEGLSRVRDARRAHSPVSISFAQPR